MIANDVLELSLGVVLVLFPTFFLGMLIFTGILAALSGEKKS